MSPETRVERTERIRAAGRAKMARFCKQAKPLSGPPRTAAGQGRNALKRLRQRQNTAAMWPLP